MPSVGIIASSFGVATATETQLRNPGGTANSMSTPDHADFTFTAFDISWFGSLDSITTDGQCFISHWVTTGSMREWSFRYQYVSSKPQLRLYLSTDGAGNVFNAVDSALITVTSNQYFGARVTWRMSDGSTKFYYSSTDPPSWTLLNTVTLLSGGPLRNSTGIVQFGGQPTAAGHAGYFRRTEIRNGFDGAGTLVANPDVRAVADTATGFTDSVGKVWTLVGAADLVNRPVP